jgi:hypothetical protein
MSDMAFTVAPGSDNRRPFAGALPALTHVEAVGRAPMMMRWISEVPSKIVKLVEVRAAHLFPRQIPVPRRVPARPQPRGVYPLRPRLQ